MKKLLIAAVILLSCFSCKPKKADLSISEVRDTVYLENIRIIHDTATLQLVTDSVRDVIRSRDSALFEARFKLARVWYYDSLCLKNSRLDKYLKGWVRRALEK